MTNKIGLALLLLLSPACSKSVAHRTTLHARQLVGTPVSEAALDAGEPLAARDGSVYRPDRQPDLWMISPASLEPLYQIEIEGLRFRVASDGRQIVYLSTDDPRFRTPEGVAVGTSLAEVARVTPNPVYEVRGWACVVNLPSGWRAAFDVDIPETGWRPCEEQISETSKVFFFFLRR